MNANLIKKKILEIFGKKNIRIIILIYLYEIMDYRVI